MIEYLKSPDNVLAFRFDGAMTAEDTSSLKTQLEQMLGQRKNLGLFCDFSGLTDIDPQAIISGIKADFEFLNHMNQIARFAVVSNKGWPGALMGTIDKIFPKVKMRAFSSAQGDEALAWVAALNEPQRITESPSIQFLPTTNENVLAFEMNGVISAAELPKVVERTESFLENHENVRMLARIKHMGGFDPSIFLQGGLFSMKFAAIQKVERYAIVGAPGWMKTIIETMNPLFSSVDMQTFPLEQEDNAWEWIGARPVA